MSIGERRRPGEIPNQKETSPKTQADLVAFQKFVGRQRTLIEAEAQKGLNYEAIFYDNFYSEDDQQKAYRDDDPAFLTLKNEYDYQAQKLLDKFHEYSQKYKGEVPPRLATGKMILGGFVHFKINGGIRNGCKKW